MLSVNEELHRVVTTKDAYAQTVDWEYVAVSSEHAEVHIDQHAEVHIDHPAVRREHTAVCRKMILRDTSLGQLKDLYMTLPLPPSTTSTPSTSYNDFNRTIRNTVLSQYLLIHPSLDSYIMSFSHPWEINFPW